MVDIVSWTLVLVLFGPLDLALFLSGWPPLSAKSLLFWALQITSHYILHVELRRSSGKLETGWQIVSTAVPCSLVGYLLLVLPIDDIWLLCVGVGAGLGLVLPWALRRSASSWPFLDFLSTTFSLVANSLFSILMIPWGSLLVTQWAWTAVRTVGLTFDPATGSTALVCNLIRPTFIPLAAFALLAVLLSPLATLWAQGRKLSETLGASNVRFKYLLSAIWLCIIAVVIAFAWSSRTMSPQLAPILHSHLSPAVEPTIRSSDTVLQYLEAHSTTLNSELVECAFQHSRTITTCSTLDLFLRENLATFLPPGSIFSSLALYSAQLFLRPVVSGFSLDPALCKGMYFQFNGEAFETAHGAAMAAEATLASGHTAFVNRFSSYVSLILLGIPRGLADLPSVSVTNSFWWRSPDPSLNSTDLPTPYCSERCFWSAANIKLTFNALVSFIDRWSQQIGKSILAAGQAFSAYLAELCKRFVVFCELLPGRLSSAWSEFRSDLWQFLILDPYNSIRAQYHSSRQRTIAFISESIDWIRSTANSTFLKAKALKDDLLYLLIDSFAIPIRRAISNTFWFAGHLSLCFSDWVASGEAKDWAVRNGKYMSLWSVNSGMNVLDWLFVPSSSLKTNGLSTIFNAHSRTVFLSDQRATVGSVHRVGNSSVVIAEIQIEELLHRLYPNFQHEIYYHFRLPSHAVVSNFTVGADGRWETPPRVVPRGAASKAYIKAAKRRSDPAMMEEVGASGEYKLRLLPELFLDGTLSIKFSYLVFCVDSVCPLPELIAKRNVYWDFSTQRSVEFKVGDHSSITVSLEPTTWWRLNSDWWPESLSLLTTAAALAPKETSAEFNATRLEVTAITNTTDGPTQTSDLLSGKQILVVVDRSRPMKSYAPQLDKHLEELQSLFRVNNIKATYLFGTNSILRNSGHPTHIVPTNVSLPKDLVFAGGQYLEDLLVDVNDYLRQAREVACVAVLTASESAAGVSFAASEPIRHFGGQMFIKHYRKSVEVVDATSDLIRALGGEIFGPTDPAVAIVDKWRRALNVSFEGAQKGSKSVGEEVNRVTTAIELPGGLTMEILASIAKFDMAATSDTVTAVESTEIDRDRPHSMLELILARQLILLKSRGVYSVFNATLDELQSTAVEYHQLSAYSSFMIVSQPKDEEIVRSESTKPRRFDRPSIDEQGSETDQDIAQVPIPGVQRSMVAEYEEEDEADIQSRAELWSTSTATNSKAAFTAIWILVVAFVLVLLA